VETPSEVPQEEVKKSVLDELTKDNASNPQSEIRNPQSKPGDSAHA